MNLANLIDGPSALIVFGGTLFSTVLRAGLEDCRLTLVKLGQLRHAAFDPAEVRAELSRQVQEIQHEGLFRAELHHLGDAEFDAATDALIHRRSISGLLESHEAYRQRRLAESDRAVRTLAQAAELSPVFGLAGTLVSLSQLPADGFSGGSFTGAISMAVVTTLYGLLGANLLLAPLARSLERVAQAEEAGRQEVIDWLAGQVAELCPPESRRGRPARAPLEAA